MSSSYKQNIECSECKKNFEIQIWTSINTDLNPELRDKVLDGSINNYTCPFCGKNNTFSYPFLYHDMKNNFMIFQSRIEDLNVTKKAILNCDESFKEDGFDKLTDDVKKRIVTSFYDLQEKIRIFENDFDDRLVELCKLHIINDYNLTHEQQISFGIFNVVNTKDAGEQPCIIFYDKDGQTVIALDASKSIHMADGLKPLLDSDGKNNWLIDLNWAFSFLKRRDNEKQFNRKEKNTFIVRWNVNNSVYGISLDDLKLQKKQRLKIIVEVDKNSDIQAGDLALVFAKYDNYFNLTYVGRFLSAHRRNGMNDDGTECYVAEILVDICFHIFEPYFQKHDMLRFIKNEDIDKGLLSEILKKDEVEYFMTWFVCMLIGLKNPSEKISFSKNDDHRQILSDYAADFCPDLKKRIFKKNNITDENYSLTYDREKILEHPMYSIETERLENILIPSERTEARLPEESDGLIINGHEIIISGEYKTLFRSAGDSPEIKRLLKDTDQSDSYLTFLPLKNSDLMDVKDKESELKNLRLWLAKNKDYGLIELENGKTESGIPFIYYIIKTLNEKYQGVVYHLVLHMKYPKGAAGLLGLFIERGMTGTRDTMIFEILRKEGKVTLDGKSVKGWNRDPYDNSIKKGFLMNLSEEKKFDDLFPLHPLSECRKAVQFIIDNN